MNDPAVRHSSPAPNPRDQWVITLSTLLSPAMPLAVAPAMKAIRPHLDTFASTAFTPQTARAVAEAERHGPVPSWDKIAPILRKAVHDARTLADENLDAATLLASPETTPHHRPDADEIARIDAILHRAGIPQLARKTRPPPDASLGLPDVSLKGAALAAVRAPYAPNAPKASGDGET